MVLTPFIQLLLASISMLFVSVCVCVCFYGTGGVGASQLEIVPSWLEGWKPPTRNSHAQRDSSPLTILCVCRCAYECVSASTQ